MICLQRLCNRMQDWAVCSQAHTECGQREEQSCYRCDQPFGVGRLVIGIVGNSPVNPWKTVDVLPIENVSSSISATRGCMTGEAVSRFVLSRQERVCGRTFNIVLRSHCRRVQLDLPPYSGLVAFVQPFDRVLIDLSTCAQMRTSTPQTCMTNLHVMNAT